MPFNVSEVYIGSQALLNDQIGAKFTNAVLAPYMKIAMTQLRQELELNNIPVTNRTSPEYTINSGVLDIGGSTGPALPLDFVDPLSCWEKQAGVPEDYMLMDRRQFLPKTSITTAYLQVWQYNGQFIEFLGATGNLNVKIDYIGDPMAGLVDENTQIRILNTENCLKFRLAALAAFYVGENKTRSDDLNGEAANALDVLLSISIKSEQFPTRRRPFRGGARANSWGRNTQ